MGSASYRGCWPIGVLSQFAGQLAAGLCGVGGVPTAGVGGLVGGSGPRLRAGFCLVPESSYPGANKQVGQGKSLVP